ncbi:MAG: hypothetical protein AAGC55_10540, partial [Myxococcota bacterium]
GTKVMYIGYLPVRSDSEFGIHRCGDELDETPARLTRLADATDGLWVVSADDVISASDDDTYDGDRVHPSVIGSARIGAHVAQAILSAENQ